MAGKTIQLHLEGVNLEKFEELFQQSGLRSRAEFLRVLILKAINESTITIPFRGTVS